MNREANVLVAKKREENSKGMELAEIYQCKNNCLRPVQFFPPEARNTDKLADNWTEINQSSRRGKSENDGRATVACFFGKATLEISEIHRRILSF
jgi:hypothetical protein